MKPIQSIQLLRTLACGIALTVGGFFAGEVRACTYQSPQTIGISGPRGLIQDDRLKERRFLIAQIKNHRREAEAMVRAGSVDYATSIARTMVPAIQSMYSNGCGLDAEGEPDPAGSMYFNSLVRELKSLSGADQIANPDNVPMRLLRDAEPIFRSCNDEFRGRVAERLRETANPVTLAKVWQELRGGGFDLLEDDGKHPRERLPRMMRFALGRSGKLEYNRMAHPRIESFFQDIAYELRDSQSGLMAKLVANDPAFLNVVAQLENIVAEQLAAATTRQALCPKTMTEAEPLLASIKQELEAAALPRQERSKPMSQSN